MDSKFLEKLKKDWSDSLLETKNQTGLSHFALSGTLSSEKDFLSRIEEGLGAEFVILHEIMRRHGGKFNLKIEETHEDGETPTTRAKFSLKLPELKSMEAVKKILDSRSVLAGHEIETFALCMAKAKEKCSTEELLQEIQKSLFRSTDCAYEIPEKNTIAIFIDDCKSEDVPKILKRIQKNCRFDLETSFVVYPDDGMDAEVLLSRVLGK